MVGWLFGWWILWDMDICRLFKAKSIFMQIVNSTVFQTIQFTMTTQFNCQKYLKLFSLFK